MCGGVRFEVTEEPLTAGYCHCTRCQRRTGTAASAQARLASGSSVCSRAKSSCGSTRPATAGRSASARRAAARSGASIRTRERWEASGSALFDPGHGIRPQWHTFVDYACEWEPIPDDGLERYPEGKPR